jgi:hypothetical protein
VKSVLFLTTFLTTNSDTEWNILEHFENLEKAKKHEKTLENACFLAFLRVFVLAQREGSFSRELRDTLCANKGLRLLGAEPLCKSKICVCGAICVRALASKLADALHLIIGKVGSDSPSA